MNDVREGLRELSINCEVLKRKRAEMSQDLARLNQEVENDKEKFVVLNNSSEIIKKAIADRREAICDNLSSLGTNALQYALGVNDIEMRIVERDYRFDVVVQD